MAISRAEVKRIADLARIALTEQEEAAYEKELSSVLEFVAELAKVDTADVAAMTGGTDLINSMRSDVAPPADAAGSAGLIDQMPRRRDGWLEVPSVWN
ncbi:MAG: Asp-tRNA(Asn)/Glu-tRNA(Gln) amidotransferase subunit GatC [Candidatus Sungbacteria bacterium]|nr:Asp-tRNA(Asn)/Glu-tRNA(Gln) amidotransferase subunit GatC [Candidatus Sungbacteria bacterium]